MNAGVFCIQGHGKNLYITKSQNHKASWRRGTLETTYVLLQIQIWTRRNEATPPPYTQFVGNLGIWATWENMGKGPSTWEQNSRHGLLIPLYLLSFSSHFLHTQSHWTQYAHLDFWDFADSVPSSGNILPSYFCLFECSFWSRRNGPPPPPAPPWTCHWFPSKIIQIRGNTEW